MEQDNSPRKIQFTVPLLEPHLDPEAAEQVRGGAGRGGAAGDSPSRDGRPLPGLAGPGISALSFLGGAPF